MAANAPKFKRYALYFVDPGKELSRFGVNWLGWDPETGQAIAPGELPGLSCPQAEITDAPRRYGFHATVVPPFRLAEGDEAALRRDLRHFGSRTAAVQLPGLELARLGRFLALVPGGVADEVNALAASAMLACDPHRADASPADLERHRAKGLTPEQQKLLQRWGYPYVMQAYRFHMTLTGKLPRADVQMVKDLLQERLAPWLGPPVPINDLALMGEDADGWFHLIERIALTGEH